MVVFRLFEDLLQVKLRIVRADQLLITWVIKWQAVVFDRLREWGCLRLLASVISSNVELCEVVAFSSSSKDAGQMASHFLNLFIYRAGE